MDPFFFGPMPVQSFLDSFMPPLSTGSPSPPSNGSPSPPSNGSPSPSTASSFNRGMFESYTALTKGAGEITEPKWYDPFVSSDLYRPPHAHLFMCLILPFQIEIIRPLLKDLRVINTSNTSRAKDKPENLKFPFDMEPDCSLYASENYDAGSEPIFDFNRVDFIIEFKTSDPFIDDPTGTQEREKGEPTNLFLCPGPGCVTSRGQLTAYATAIMSTQYRTHLFMVLIVKEYARLIRWDRGGAVVTERFLLNDESYLFDFLTRYDMASREDRGHDTTVSVSDADDIDTAKKLISDWENIQHFLTVTMPKPAESRFIIPRPKAQPMAPVGRWTRSSVAYDIQNSRQVYLKDSWRVLIGGIRKEGDVYRQLHDKKVPNIPPCLMADDIGADDSHHRTRTHEQVTDKKGAHSYWDLTPHRHYR
jgi:hypothetical protein